MRQSHGIKQVTVSPGFFRDPPLLVLDKVNKLTRRAHPGHVQYQLQVPQTSATSQTAVVDLCAGDAPPFGVRFAVAVLTSGAIVAWTEPQAGDDGPRFVTDLPAVTGVPQGIKASRVVCGSGHVLAMTTLNGKPKVVAWGDNAAGQATVPADVNSAAAAGEAVLMSAGAAHSVFLLPKTGKVFISGTVNGVAGVPAELSGRADLAAVASGDEHIVALTKSGGVVTAGSNAQKQRDLPHIPAGSKAISVSAGSASSQVSHEAVACGQCEQAIAERLQCHAPWFCPCHHAMSRLRSVANEADL
jgi:alpha-tubulin suppressor-like RCC1 family protein